MKKINYSTISDSLIIHIHGFLSSHRAQRVDELTRYLTVQKVNMDVVSPCLSEHPEQAIAELDSLIKEQQRVRESIFLLGHSMGAYYATYLASKYNLRAVLINPVVRGYEIMCEFFGDCYNPHTGRRFAIGENDIAFLASINIETLPNPNLFFVLQDVNDDIVNSTDVIEYYEDCKLILENGGSHDFEYFHKYVADIIGFFRCSPIS